MQSDTPDQLNDQSPDSDEHMGAVEGDRPTDTQQGNSNADGALDDQGMPKDKVAICEDVLGANVDKSQG